MLGDKEQKIARPRQVYLGHPCREFEPIEQREHVTVAVR
jgi:citrate synthase